MDSQTNALYDNQAFVKYGLNELSFNAMNAQKHPKSAKAGDLLSAASSQGNTPSAKKFRVVPTGISDSKKKALETSTSPFLSPSASFIKSKHHHSMKSLKLGRTSYYG